MMNPAIHNNMNNDLPNLYTKVLKMNTIDELIENYEMLIEPNSNNSYSIKKNNIVQEYINKIHLVALYPQNIMKDKKYEKLYETYNKTPFFVNMLKKKLLNLISSTMELLNKKNSYFNDIHGH